MVHIKIPVDVDIILEQAVKDFLKRRDSHKIIVHLDREKLDQRYHSSFYKIKRDIFKAMHDKWGVSKKDHQIARMDYRHIPYFYIEIDKKEAKRIIKGISDAKTEFSGTLSSSFADAIGHSRLSYVRYIPEAVAPYFSKPGKPNLLERITLKMEGLFNLDQMGVYNAHDKGYFGEGVNVAIVDTGVDYKHQEFIGRFNPNKLGYDFVEHSNDPMDKNRPYYHGTHVAGTAFGLNTGVAPGCNAHGLRVLNEDGFGFEADIIDANMWCLDHGMHEINYSLGAAEGSEPEEMSFRLMSDKGIGITVAAGNDGGRFKSYPASYNIEGLMSVAAINRDNSHADFSNIDETVAISAYGVGILSASRGNSYVYMDGTSMAAPHIAGLRALIRSYLGGNAVDNKQKIRNTAEPLGDPEYFGAGLGRADTWYGSQKAIANASILKELLAQYR